MGGWVARPPLRGSAWAASQDGEFHRCPRPLCYGCCRMSMLRVCCILKLSYVHAARVLHSQAPRDHG